MNEAKLAEKTAPSAAMIDGDAVVVRHYYKALYTFGLCLTGSMRNAVELTWAACQLQRSSGSDLDQTRTGKSGMFSTLYRQFLGTRQARHSPVPPVDSPNLGMAPVTPGPSGKREARCVIAALQDLDETYRAPLALFHLEEFSCRDIAEILGRPVDTIISQIAHGKGILQRSLQLPSRHLGPSV